MIWTMHGQGDIGLHREENQDRFAVLPERGLLCVADGMGGMQDGAEAAQAVISGVGGMAFPEDLTGAELEERLLSGLESISGDMFARWRQRGGATLALLLADGNDVLTVTSGDSEAFFFREGNLEPIGTPHNEFSALLKRGLVKKDDLHHPARSYLTAYMGMPPPWKRCFARISACSGDMFLVCSDGIGGMLTHREIADILRIASAGDDIPRNVCQHLIDAALRAGGYDNMAVAVAYAAKDEQ